MPYGFIASTEAVAERVCGGERLTRPGECPDALWALLQRMWAERPADRPTFVEVAEALVVLRTRVNQPTEANAGVPTQVAVGDDDAVEEHGVQDYLSVIESPATDSKKIELITDMLRLEMRPHVLKVFSETAMWRGQGEKGYFHGAPKDWNFVAAALRSEARPRPAGLETETRPSSIHGVEQQVFVAAGAREAQELADAEFAKRLQMQLQMQVSW